MSVFVSPVSSPLIFDVRAELLEASRWETPSMFTNEAREPDVIGFAYVLMPPVWLGGSLAEADLAAPRGTWDEIARAELTSGITAWCFRNGLFAFDLTEWPLGAPGWADAETVRERDRWRTHLVNTHLACLYTASKRRGPTLHPMLVNPDDLIHLHSPDTFSAGGMVATTQVLRANWTTNSGPPPKDDWRLLRGTTVDLDAITQSYDQLDEILSTGNADQLLPVVDVALRGSVAHYAKAWDAALIQSWAAIERLLTGIWETYIAENRERVRDGERKVFINADRKDQLLKGRDYTISVVSEILSLLDVLPDEIYRRLKPIRQARNGWMHQLEPVSASASAQSLSILFDLLRHLHRIDLDPLPDVMFARGL